MAAVYDPEPSNDPSDDVASRNPDWAKEAEDRAVNDHENNDGDEDEEDFSQGYDDTSDEDREALGVGDSDDEDPDDDNFLPVSERPSLMRSRLTARLAKRGGAGLTTLAIAIISGIGLTTMVAPFKLVGIMKTIDERYFAANNSALDEGTSRLVSKYINDRVIPALSKPGCSSRKITKDCVATVTPNSGPIGEIFDRMREAKYEERLADSGLEFRNINGRLFMLVDKGDSDGLVSGLSDSSSSPEGVFDIEKSGGVDKLTSRREIRQMFREKIRTTGKHDKLWHYYKIAGFAEKKYGLKKCFVACDLRDDYADWKQDFKENTQHLNYRKRALAGVSSRVISKVDAGYGFLVQCLITSACDENTLSDDPKDREKQTFFERKMSEEARKLVARGEKVAVQEALKKFDDITKAGSVRGYLLEKILQKFVSEQLAKEVAKRGIPVLGWIDLFNTIAKKMSNLPKLYTGLRYSIMSAGAISSYMTLRTHADEITTGDTQGELTQAAAGLLGEDNPSDDPSLGAEKSRVFQDMMSSNPLQVVGLFGTSYAQSTTSTTAYPCEDGDNPRYIQPDEATCPNERFDLTNDKVEAIGKTGKAMYAVSEPYDKSVGKAMKGAETLVSTLTEPVVKGLLAVPGVQDKVDALTNAASEEIQKTIQEGNLLDTPFTDKINGPQLINAVIAGAELLGNQAASEQLGLPEDKNGTVTVGLWESMESDERQRFMTRPLYARLFDKNDRLSLVSQMYLSRPQPKSDGFVANIAALILQTPSLSTTTAQTLVVATSGRSLAATPTKHISHFGLTTYALSPDSPIYDEIIEKGGYTEEECKQMDDEWYASARIDDKTSQTVYQTTNKCRLWKGIAMGTIGAFVSAPNSDPALTPEPDTADAATGGIQDSGGDGVYDTDLGDLKENSDSIACAAGTTDLGVVKSQHNSGATIRLCRLGSIGGKGQTTAGVNQFQGAVVNSRVSEAYQKMGEKAKADGHNLSSFSSFRLGDSCGGTGDGGSCATKGGSMHQLGAAIDFENGGGVFIKGAQCSNRAVGNTKTWRWLKANAAAYGIKQYAAESWHWDTSGLENRCE